MSHTEGAHYTANSPPVQVGLQSKPNRVDTMPMDLVASSPTSIELIH
jgi:hypothetical protein